MDALYQRLYQEVLNTFESVQLPTLERWVNQPSHTRAPEDVEAMASLLDQMAEELGLSIERHPVPDGQFAQHRVFTTPGTQAGDKALLLSGHCDTVHSREQGFLSMQRNGDKLHGPGTLDMKGGLAVLFFALKALKTIDPEGFRRFKCRTVVVTDEEVGSSSSLPLYEELAKVTEAALVMEGGRNEDKIITSRKGSGAFTLTVIGKDAHAGNDHAHGVNAIHGLALLIPKIEALTDYEEGTTVNVGVIEGGTAKNTVPGRASCIIDVRVSTTGGARHFETSLKGIGDNPFSGPNIPERLQLAQVELRGRFMRLPMEATSGTDKLRARYEAHAAKVGLGIGEAPTQGGGSDANLLAAAGVPVIDGLGPFGKFFHSPNEWCSVDSLLRRTQALATFLAEWNQETE